MSLAAPLKEWPQLVRFGIPQFQVIRHPIMINGETTEPGNRIPPVLAANIRRVRQLYEQFRIAPIENTIVAAPPRGMPASEAQIPAAVLDDIAMSTPIPMGDIAVSVPVAEIDDIDTVVTGVVPVRAASTNQHQQPKKFKKKGRR